MAIGSSRLNNSRRLGIRLPCLVPVRRQKWEKRTVFVFSTVTDNNLAIFALFEKLVTLLFSLIRFWIQYCWPMDNMLHFTCRKHAKSLQNKSWPLLIFRRRSSSILAHHVLLGCQRQFFIYQLSLVVRFDCWPDTKLHIRLRFPKVLC